MSDEVQVPQSAEGNTAEFGGTTTETPQSQSDGTTGVETGTEADIAGWARSLKGKYQTHPVTKEFESVTDLFESYINGKAPDPDAPAERWEAYYKSMGRPDSPDEYELPEVQFEGTDEFSQWYKEKAHAAGLTKRQARQMFEMFGDRVAEQSELMDKQRTERTVEGMQKLKAEWGDTYDANLDLANRTFKSFTTEEQRQEMARMDLLDNPVIIQMFAKLGNELSEDAVVGGRPAGSGDGLMPIDPATGYRQIQFKD